MCCMLVCMQLISLTVQAQERQVFVQNRSTDAGDVIAVKWFSQYFLYPEGVHVYRRVAGGDWERITEQPLMIDAYTAAEEAAREELEFFNAVLKEPSQGIFQEDILLLQFVLQGILDNDFALHAGIYYEDAAVTKGQSYQYRVVQLRRGTEVEIGISEEITAAEPAPLAPVQQLTVVQEDRHVTFDWIPEEDRFFGVNIYKKEGDDPEKLLNENPLVVSMIEDSVGNLTYPSPMFKEDRLKQNTRYVYRVVGVDYFGQETLPSPPITVDFKDITPPNAPETLLAKGDSMKVHLDWNYEETEVIGGFKVYRSVLSDGPYESILPELLPRDARHFTDTLSLPGPYYYYITAVDLNGNEAKSFTTFAEVQDVKPPLPPQGFTIQADSGLISLHWDANTEPDLGGYFIYRTSQSDAGSHYVPLNAEPQKANSYYDTLAGNIRSSFFYYIVAADTSYNRSMPSERLSAKMPDLLPPEKPFLKSISQADDYIELVWIRNVDNDLMGYDLYKRPEGMDSLAGKKVNLNAIDREAFRFRDRNWAQDGTMDYYLVAYDSAGNRSRPSNVLVNYREDAPQTEGTIELEVKYHKRKKQNRLSWSASTDEALLGYVLFRGESAEGCRPYTGLIKTTEYTDKVNPKEKQYYQIRAYYSDGAVISSQIKN